MRRDVRVRDVPLLRRSRVDRPTHAEVRDGGGNARGSVRAHSEQQADLSDQGSPGVGRHHAARSGSPGVNGGEQEMAYKAGRTLCIGLAAAAAGMLAACGGSGSSAETKTTPKLTGQPI